jgi:ceramide glucosyltransferase
MLGVSSLLIFHGCGLVIAVASVSYLVLAIWRVVSFEAPRDVAANFRPAVTILKPICGLEPRLYECLRSFCELDYEPLQIIFGVGNSTDAAIELVKQLTKEFPNRDLKLVIDHSVHGTNLKVGNLVNMYRSAKHDVIVLSDSDTEVARNSMDALVGPLEDPSVGAVTCLYKGVPAKGFASALGALFINDWFLASAVVDAGMRDVAYCFGPVTAVRRDALDAIGGFGKLSFHLADDFMLGRMIVAAGYRVRLSRYIADIVVAETFASLARHELRWARTVRAVKPAEHFLSVVMEPLPLLAALLLPFPTFDGWALLGAVLLLRVVLHYAVRWRFAITTPAQPWLLPLRECLCFAVWMASFPSTKVRWRQHDFIIAPGGRLEPRAVGPTVASSVR